jgi:hypothetical protein
VRRLRRADSANVKATHRRGFWQPAAGNRITAAQKAEADQDASFSFSKTSLPAPCSP